MKKTIKFDKDTKDFELNQLGFISAVSFKESSSDLSLSLKDPTNVQAAKTSNKQGYLGLFQFGEEALYELGYYAGDHNISYVDLKNNPSLKQKWQSQFSNNNWSGSWTGKRNINSKSDFLNNPQAQYEIIKEWIAYLFSDKNGGPGESTSHINGEVGDIGYIRKDRNHLTGVNFDMEQYDHEATLKFVNILISFGWGKNKNMLSEKYPLVLANTNSLKANYTLPKTSHYSKVRHNNHLHLQGLSTKYNKDE